jgi:hypothetical protein
MTMRHFVPPFTRINGRKQQAACGLYVRPEEIAPRATEPTCPECLAYCEADAATAKELAEKHGEDVEAQADALFSTNEDRERNVGVAEPLRSIINRFSATADYTPKGGTR